MINLNDWGATYPDGKTHFPAFHNTSLYQEKYGLVLKTPANGTTTKNSSFPRCELREMLHGKKAAWDSSCGKHKFKGIFSVTRFPRVKPEVCVFQIHDGKNDVLQIIVSPDWVKYKYNNYKIVLGTYQIEEKFQIKVKIYENRLYLKYNFNDYIHLPIQGKKLYFRTGNYLQTNDKIEDDPTEYSMVLLHRTKVRHFIQ